MMKPLTQISSGYSSAMGELISQCDELSIPAPQNTVTKPSYPAVRKGGIQYPAWIDQGLVPATVKTSTRPAYPPIAKRLGIQGSMVISVRVDASGEPKQAWVSSRWFNGRDIPGPPGKPNAIELLKEIGVAHAMSGTYAPATRDGVAVESVFKIPLRFLLEK
jgi:hypothetical protein